MHHALFRPLLAGSDNTIISYYFHKSSYFGKTFLQKMKWWMTGYTERTISLKTLWQSVWSKYKPFWINMRKKSAGWMDKFTKKYLWPVVYHHKDNPWVRYLHAADVRYHLDCWLVWVRLPGAIVTTITTSLVWNRQNRWLDIAITSINADLVQVYQTCMFVCTFYRYDCWLDATVKYTGNGQMQLL